MKQTTYRTALALAILGLGASAESTYVHYRLIHDPLYTSVCDINSTLSCTQVYASRFSTVASVPVALIGLLWFVLVVLLLAGATRSDRLRENVPSYLFALSTLALAAVLYLGYASFFVLKAVCVFCVLTYAAVVGLFAITGAATSYPMTTVPTRALGDLRKLATTPLALALTLLYIGGAATALAFFPRGGGVAEGTSPPATQDVKTEFERFLDTEPRAVVPVDAGTAKVVVVKFNDWQCPPCRQTYQTYKPIFDKWERERPGAVKVVLKDYPLDPDCNKYAPRGGHLSACEAAVAVRLARRQNRDLQLEEWIFAHQEELSPAVVKDAAREIGQVQDFDAQYPKVVEEVKADIALGALLKVKATPTFFINGLMVEGGFNPQFFDAAIAHELKKADAKK
ncbi:MAG: thioredoxin domain-containing protein [Acidobacteria bacterium]|nr:thioredoxin domain-containing protein [Acidobacteriota bacterium]MBI3262890.1 thioredoxin domain-containing protein [Acidobacteriota bacterium]